MDAPESTPVALDQSNKADAADDSHSSFFDAVQHGNVDIVSQLLADLDDGTFVSAKHHEGRTALHLAVSEQHVDIIEILLKYGADIEAVADDGRRPLFIAAEQGDSKTVDILAQAGASVESSNDKAHSTALLAACGLGHNEVVQLLIQLEANIEAALADGRRPLFLAVASGNAELTQHLLQAGADKTIVSEDGRDLATVAGQDAAIVELLGREYLLPGPKTDSSKSKSARLAKVVHRPEPPSEDEGDKHVACKTFDASIVQFFTGDRERRSKPVTVTVWDLLYGRGPVAIMRDALKDIQVPKEPSFTWYHLPANNMKWAEDLALRLLVDHKPIGLPNHAPMPHLGLFDGGARQGRVRARHGSPAFLRPVCRTAEKNANFSWHKMPVKPLVAVIPYLNFEYHDDFRRMTKCLDRAKKHKRRSVKPKTPPRLSTASPPSPPPPPSLPMNLDHGPVLPSSNPDLEILPATTVHELPENRETQTAETENVVKIFSEPNVPKESHSKPHNRIVNWLARGMSTRRSELHQENQEEEPVWGPEGQNPQVALIQGYASGNDPTSVSLQPRRTLDQYFYSHLDSTADRDSDQVVYRYTRDHEQPKLFMVDQLWLWVLNGDTVITCAPLRWSSMSTERLSRPPRADSKSDAQSAPRQSEHNLIQGPWIVFGSRPVGIDENNPVQSSDSSRISTSPGNAVGAYASTISSSRHTNERPKVRPNDPLNLLQSTLENLKETTRDPITSATEFGGFIATCCANLFDEHRVPEGFEFFEFFEHSVSHIIDQQARKLYQFKNDLEVSDGSIDPSASETTSAVSGEMKMSIDDEIGLLVEVADIRDELHSLEVVLTDQSKIMEQLQEVQVNNGRGIDLVCVKAHLSRIQQLEQLTDKAQESLYQLVDLKQKNASFVAARTQARLVKKTLS